MNAAGPGGSDHGAALLVTLSGRDRPGLTARLCGTLAGLGCRITDMEQVVIRDQLTLGILLAPVDASLSVRVRQAVAPLARSLGLTARFTDMHDDAGSGRPQRHSVTVLGQPLGAAALAAVTAAITDAGANIDRIVRLSRYPVLSFELLVSGGDAARLRAGLAATAADQRVDVAVQRADLYRRAKRLICFDVDSTLITGEMIELLARRAGHGRQVAAITEAAMRGELDFTASLLRRVRLLAGLPQSVLDEVAGELELTPGARTVVRTLRRLGFTLAIVSGGFTVFTDMLKQRLGFDYAAANVLEVVDGRLSGRVTQPILDRAAKADHLAAFAADAGVPLSQTVAVGDGANDLDMLSRAGLGIAFNAKPSVRAAADTAVTVPYLDAILFLLGISREEVEAADADDPNFQVVTPPSVPLQGSEPRPRPGPGKAG